MASPREFVDLSGMTFNRWRVLAYATRKRYEDYWKCECSCGTQRELRQIYLTTGVSKSCGCLAAEVTAARSMKHSHAKRGNHSETYEVWEGMKKRCATPSMSAYKYYGGRGISVCEQWMKYEQFLHDMGEKPDGLTLDRINPDGNYEPSNCRWATVNEQRNNRRDSVMYAAFGMEKSLHDWAVHTGLPHGTLYQRIRKGSGIEEALTRKYYSREHQSVESRFRKPK